MFDYSELRCKFMEREDIVAKVNRFRSTYWSENTVPVDMEEVIMRLGLDIIPVSGINQLERIDAYLTSDRTGVVVDKTQYMDDLDRYASRLRFSFAHEIGHFVLHEYIYRKFDIETPEKYFEFINNFPSREYSSFEWQANEFAGSLLVPIDRLVKEVQNCKQKLKEENMYWLWEKDKLQVLNSFSPYLRRVFGVSDSVIDTRILLERDLLI
jgi:Zn-dependent peptidase ImmA (M78 family)